MKKFICLWLPKKSLAERGGILFVAYINPYMALSKPRVIGLLNSHLRFLVPASSNTGTGLCYMPIQDQEKPA